MGEVASAISALGNILIACAAIAAAIAAFLGLDAWKKEQQWRVDHELAKRALLSVYRFRDSLYAIRHPAMSNSEMTLSEEEKQSIIAGSERSAGVINAYANRWQQHSEASSELNALLLETDAVWGTDLREKIRPLHDLEHELFAYISLHIDAYLRGDSDLAKDYREILKGKRDILYDLLDAEKDEFRKEFEQCLCAVEQSLRKKLGGQK